MGVTPPIVLKNIRERGKNMWGIIATWRMDKEDVFYIFIHIYVYTHIHTHTHTHTMEYYSAIKRNETMSFAATWMDLEIIIFSKVSQKENKYHVISLI